MGVVQIQRRDTGWIGCKIAQNSAAARSDGDDMIARLDRQRFHVDQRVFPNLRINQPFKGLGEQPFEQACGRQRRVAVHRIAEAGFRRPPQTRCDTPRHSLHRHLSQAAGR